LRSSIQKNQIALAPPQTQPAEFAVPVYASPEKVNKTGLLVALGLLGGGFMGLVGLVARKVYRGLLKQLSVQAGASRS
jgi:hypothetical protein